MKTTLDEQALFDTQQLDIEVGSFSRDSIERTVCGLNGVLSIDLGQRSRKIRQKGTLRARSRVQMDERISKISACMDGRTHTLIAANGCEFSNVRMDSFVVGKEHADGACISIDYEILYTQLA
ncbi:MAG: hypothetical protein JSW66_02060 [Phycisphaerales bacterium]|nr:MAG: hypothetical protein JSW66_02060 [Phycisphaerales bacterium]